MAAQHVVSDKSAGFVHHENTIELESARIDEQSKEVQEHEAHEVFKKNAGGVDFRTVSWPRASVIFLKIQFAMSILAVPSALGTLGAVGGALSIVGWGALNTCERQSTMTIDIHANAAHRYRRACWRLSPPSSRMP